VSSSFQQALENLYGLERRREKLGLDGTRMLLRALGDPQRAFRSVHVAGTNGKGSVCAIIERVLRHAGVRTGLYTSPHLVDFRERIRVNGQWADEGALEARLAKIEALPGGEDRTFFEVATALAFDDFKNRRVEWAVIEVGLGGRLDSTNVIEPDLAVITRVAMDHAEILGADIASIAAEKAGIVKPGATVITGPQAPEAMTVIERVCRERGARLVHASDAWRMRPAGIPRLALRGSHQRENVQVAHAAVKALAGRGITIGEAALVRGLREARWPGRLERCPNLKRLWWDGAHNPSGMAALGRAWRDLGFAPPALVLALSRDKDAAEMAAQVKRRFAGSPIVVTRTRNPRAMPTATLAAALTAAGFEVEEAPDVPAAIRQALDRDRRRNVLLAGSLFAVGEAMEAFGGAPGEWL
jgi:dihydrofolate synthase / folylpolyglutamate synthase